MDARQRAPKGFAIAAPKSRVNLGTLRHAREVAIKNKHIASRVRRITRAEAPEQNLFGMVAEGSRMNLTNARTMSNDEEQ